MNRTLTSFLAAAAVVGATGGTLAAVTLAGNGDGDEGSDAGRGPAASAGTSTPSGSPTTPSTTPPTTPSRPGETPTNPSADDGGAGPGEPGEVFWANQRVLQDGDLEVRIQLVDPPASLERATGSWVVTTRSSPQEPSYEASVVRPDGSVTFLADTVGDGDVSPDGTRYVAMSQDGSGYGVWDVASGEQIETVSDGATPDQYPVGGAQFVGDDAVAATWSDDRGRDVVLLGRLETAPVDPSYDEPDEMTLVSEDVVGPWAISPDGRWFAGSSRTAKDAETGFDACALVAPVVGPADSPAPGTTDCGSTFSGVPSFKDDSSAVLALPYDTDGFGPGLLRPLVTSGTSRPAQIDLPDASLGAVYLRDDLVVVLGATNLQGDATTISACDSTGCESLFRPDDAAATAVLGTTT